MADLTSYFGKNYNKKPKREELAKTTKIIISSSDEEPIKIKMTPPKRRSKRSKILSEDESQDENTPKHKNSNKNSSFLYEKISKVVSQQQNPEIDPETYFESQSVLHLHKVKKSKRKHEANVKDDESVLSDTPYLSQSPKKLKKNMDDSIAHDNRPAFIQAMQREAPKMLGKRSLPIGAKNCLEGLIFVVSGILEYFDRDDIKSLIQRYGGKSTTSLSGRTSYLVVGREPGPMKINKARELGTSILNEDQFYKLISGTKESVDEIVVVLSSDVDGSSKKKAPLQKLATAPKHTTRYESELWVEKYKPLLVKDIIGQHGPKSAANKLLKWLTDWGKNRNTKYQKNFLASKEDGSIYKAALLSGQPGVGKSTTAALVCKELGYDIVELNASDARSKKCLDSLLLVSLQNFRITNDEKAKKSVFIMDEVDGMSGNEDRGGVQELITLIKTSQVPIICICNDRMHPKIRSLSNYCFDLRFSKPRIEQIKSYILNISSKEGLDMEPQAAEQMITAAHNDIRSILNNLQMWAASKQIFEYDATKKEAKNSEKDTKENIFEVARKIFSKSATSKMSIIDKSDLFFVDYSIIPLFVFENYLICVTQDKQNIKLSNIARAADSMSLGVLCENQIRTSNNWALLPTQAILSTVIPSELISGAIVGQINFPQWLGKNSTTNKNNRIIQELVMHTQLKCHGTRSMFNLDYLPFMKSIIYNPIADNSTVGVDDVIDRMIDYDLVRTDWDSIVDLSQWSSSKLKPIETKAKSAFTRKVNKIDRQLPYSLSVITKAKNDTFNGGLDQDEEDSLPDEDKNDPMIKELSTPAPKPAKKKITRKVKT